MIRMSNMLLCEKKIRLINHSLILGFTRCIVDRRNDDECIQDTLKSVLNVELKYLEEKRKIEEEAKLIMGNEMSKKMHEISDARVEAYVSGNGLQ